MSIVFASEMSSHDLRLLGNNLRPAGSTRRKCRPARGEPNRRARHTRRRALVAAVNRSIAGLGERIDRLRARSPVA